MGFGALIKIGFGGKRRAGCRDAYGEERAGLGLPCALCGCAAFFPSFCACPEELRLWAAEVRACCISEGGMCLNTHPLRESVAAATRSAALNFPILGFCLPAFADGL